jgi:hypothetical protein
VAVLVAAVEPVSGDDDDQAPGRHRPAGLHGQYRSGVLVAGLPADLDAQAEPLELAPDRIGGLAGQRGGTYVNCPGYRG